MRKYLVISGDGHIEGPIDFRPYLPEKYKDMAPTLVQREDGAWTWQMDWNGATASMLVGSNVYSGLRYDQFVAKNACNVLERRWFVPARGVARPGGPLARPGR